VHGKIGRRYLGKPDMTAYCARRPGRPRPGRPLVNVTAWRRSRLLETGFPESLADRLAADATVDMHALLQLVDRGCPPELAVHILVPS
jgi:hypothetical protein